MTEITLGGITYRSQEALWAKAQIPSDFWKWCNNRLLEGFTPEQAILDFNDLSKDERMIAKYGHHFKPHKMQARIDFVERSKAAAVETAVAQPLVLAPVAPVVIQKPAVTKEEKLYTINEAQLDGLIDAYDRNATREEVRAAVDMLKGLRDDSPHPTTSRYGIGGRR